MNIFKRPQIVESVEQLKSYISAKNGCLSGSYEPPHSSDDSIVPADRFVGNFRLLDNEASIVFTPNGRHSVPFLVQPEDIAIGAIALWGRKPLLPPKIQ